MVKTRLVELHKPSNSEADIDLAQDNTWLMERIGRGPSNGSDFRARSQAASDLLPEDEDKKEPPASFDYMAYTRLVSAETSSRPMQEYDSENMFAYYFQKEGPERSHTENVKAEPEDCAPFAPYDLLGGRNDLHRFPDDNISEGTSRDAYTGGEWKHSLRKNCH